MPGLQKAIHYLIGIVVTLALPIAGQQIPAEQVGRSIVFDVTRYGAKGDGVADDTEAIHTAIEKGIQSGGTIYFPAGRYLLTSGIT